MIDLSIIIVNWNSLDYLKACLRSIQNSAINFNHEVIVVDNASQEHCESAIKKEFPKIIFIQSKENLGFARANNLGFQYSSGKNILFLNPDTEVFSDAVIILNKELNRLEDAGAIGGRLLNSDGSIQTSCIQSFPTILNQVLNFDILRRLFPRLKIWGMRPLFLDPKHPAEVEVISGAALLVKREIFQQVGLFSSDFFMYTEDVDLCYKIAKHNYKNYFTNKATIIHHNGGASQKKSDQFESIVTMQDSIAIFFRKTRGEFYCRLYRSTMFFISILRLLMIAFIAPFKLFFKSRCSVNYSLNKWKRILRWSLGFEHRMTD